MESENCISKELYGNTFHSEKRGPSGCQTIKSYVPSIVKPEP